MPRNFRWIGPGNLTGIIDGKAVVYLGRREDANGKITEGDVVSDLPVDKERLDGWVKAGMAEYVGPIEGMVSAAKSKQSEESKAETERLQGVQDQVDSASKVQAMGRLRELLSGPLFDDDDRKVAEMEFREVPPARVKDFLADIEAERKKRQAALEDKGKAKGKKPESESQMDTEGAGPKKGDAR